LDLVDYDPGPTFETRVWLPAGWRLEITQNLTNPADLQGVSRWSCDFSTDPYGSGVFGQPQCDLSAIVDGVPVPLSFAANNFNPPEHPCWYANLSISTPTAPVPATLCP
jgi:hypothetical protein